MLLSVLVDSGGRGDVFLSLLLPPILFSLSFLSISFCFNVVELKKCPLIMHFFLENKINIWHQIVKLGKQPMMFWLQFWKLFTHLQKKKNSFDFSWTMSPVVFCGLAKHVLIKFTAEPSCSQRCLCRLLLKISQRSCRIRMDEWACRIVY